MAGAAKDVRTDGGSGVRLARMDRFQVLRRIDRCYVIKKKKSIDENICGYQHQSSLGKTLCEYAMMLVLFEYV